MGFVDGSQKVNYVSADMTDFGAVQASIAKIVDMAGPIDVLVANAGTGIPGYFLEQVSRLCLAALSCSRQYVVGPGSRGSTPHELS